jgi:hypothetical protein
VCHTALSPQQACLQHCHAFWFAINQLYMACAWAGLWLVESSVQLSPCGSASALPLKTRQGNPGCCAPACLSRVCLFRFRFDPLLCIIIKVRCTNDHVYVYKLCMCEGGWGWGIQSVSAWLRGSEMRSCCSAAGCAQAARTGVGHVQAAEYVCRCAIVWRSLHGKKSDVYLGHVGVSCAPMAWLCRNVP